MAWYDGSAITRIGCAHSYRWPRNGPVVGPAHKCFLDAGDPRQRVLWLATCHKNANLRWKAVALVCISGGSQLSDRRAAARRVIR